MFIDYLTKDRKKLIADLGFKSQQLAERHTDLAFLRSQEREAKLTYLDLNPELSIRDREKMADRNALDVTKEIFQCEAEIRGLEIECAYIREVIGVI